jgi:hypothetical protein
VPEPAHRQHRAGRGRGLVAQLGAGARDARPGLGRAELAPVEAVDQRHVEDGDDAPVAQQQVEVRLGPCVVA